MSCALQHTSWRVLDRKRRGNRGEGTPLIISQIYVSALSSPLLVFSSISITFILHTPDLAVHSVPHFLSAAVPNGCLAVKATRSLDITTTNYPRAPLGVPGGVLR